MTISWKGERNFIFGKNCLDTLSVGSMHGSFQAEKCFYIPGLVFNFYTHQHADPAEQKY